MTRTKHTTALVGAAVILALVIVTIMVCNSRAATEVKGVAAERTVDREKVVARARGVPASGRCEVMVRVLSAEDTLPMNDVDVCAHSVHDLSKQFCGTTSNGGVADLSWPCASGSAPESMIAIARQPGHAQLRNSRFIAKHGSAARATVLLAVTDKHLKGEIRDIYGGPVEGAWIWASCEGMNATWENAWDAAAVSSSISLPSGEFSLALNSRCRLDRLMVKAEGYANYSDDIIDSGSEELIVALAPESVIRGQVLAGELPVDDASVVALAGRFGNDQGLRAVSDADGRFEISGVPPGQWTVRAQKANTLGIAADVVDVRMGVRVDAVDIQMLQMAAVDVSLHNMRDGLCADSLASLWPLSTVGLAFGALSSTPLDENRQATFRAVAPGRYTIKVRCSGYAVIQSEAFELSGADVRLIELEFPRGESVAGRVVDTEGAPVSACVASAEGARQSCDDKGEFELWLTPEYPKTLHISRPDGSFANIDLDESPGEGFQVQLSQVSEFRGKVIGPSGIGVSNLQISSDSGELYADLDCSRTDAGGSFSCKYAGEAGTWAGRIDAKRRDVSLGHALVNAGDDDVTVQTDTAAITGQVVRTSGEPAEFVYVSLFEERDGRRSFVASVQADAQGRFELEGAFKGLQHHLRAVGDDGSIVELAVHEEPVLVTLPDSIPLVLETQHCEGTGRVGVYRQGQMLPVLERLIILQPHTPRVVVGKVAAGSHEIRLEIPACGTKKVAHEVGIGEVESVVRVAF